MNRPPATATGASAPQATRLAGLRDDLQIAPASQTETGQPQWIIYDPLQHRHFHIDAVARELLCGWQAGATAREIAERVGATLGSLIEVEDVERLEAFLRRNSLLEDRRDGVHRELAARARDARHGLAARLVHNYLFFRVPLLRPQRALEQLLPWCAPLFSRGASALFATIGLLGLYLVTRQWDAFLSTFHQFMTLEGAVSFAIALLVVKALHELGHALAAVRYGCRVPTMGVAFMMLTPLLYTDVSDAWRLRSRQQRLVIDCAGIVVELWIASIATLAWAFLPDGALRGIAFVIATSGWLMSLALNLNPFMRFDGYYILSDLIGIDNLQARSFEFGRWKLRQLLFAPRLAAPEPLSASYRRGLIAYAWAVWLYRLVLFTGIALFVYAYFFKALGLVLFAVEIWYFILSPVAHEIRAWFSATAEGRDRSRTIATVSVAGVILLAAIVPWSGSVTAPAILEAGDVARVYPPRSARVEAVHVAHGQQVSAGDVLVRLASPDIDSELIAVEIKISALKLRLARAGSDQADRADYRVLVKELDAHLAKRDGLARERSELVVRAPVGGVVLELDPALVAGRWVARNDAIGLVGGRQTHVAKGYIAESDINRVGPGSQGYFLPDDPRIGRIALRLKSIAEVGATTIDIPELASVFGGRVDAEFDNQQRVIPVSAHYHVELVPDGAIERPSQVLRGIVRLDGIAESFAARGWRQVARVLQRESGF